MTEKKNELSAAEIEKYLRQNLDFFQGRDDLLSLLIFPHSSGEALSFG